jgi:hypothetical protein
MYRQHRFNFFEQLSYAVAKPMQYYRLTKVSGAGLTGFVFLFTLIISLFTVIPMFYTMIGPNGLSRYLRNELPEFDLSNGELYVSTAYEEVSEDIYIRVDTNVGSFRAEDIDTDYSRVILISRTNLIIKSSGRVQEFDFADLQGLHVDNSIVAAAIPFIYLFLIFIAVIIYIFTAGYYFLSALFYSLVGLIVSSVRHANLTYATIFKTAVYSKVTIGILYALADLTPFSVTGMIRITISFAVTCTYVILGILSHTSDEAYEEAGIPVPPRYF